MKLDIWPISIHLQSFADPPQEFDTVERDPDVDGARVLLPDASRGERRGTALVAWVLFYDQDLTGEIWIGGGVIGNRTAHHRAAYHHKVIGFGRGHRRRLFRSSREVELNPLCKRQALAIVDRITGSTHIGLPRIRACFTAAPGLLLAAEGASNFGPGWADIDVRDSAVGPLTSEEV